MGRDKKKNEIEQNQVDQKNEGINFYSRESGEKL